MAVPRLVVARLRALRQRIEGDAVLAAEVAEFTAQPDTAWVEAVPDITCEVGDRRCRISASEVTLSHAAWPGSKRIPL